MDKNEVLSVRLPNALLKLVRKHIERSMSMSASEFVRQAIKEKLMKDSPELYEEQLNGT